MPSARPLTWLIPLSLALATVILCINTREAGVRPIVVYQPAPDPGDVVVSRQYSNPDSFIFLNGRYLRQPYEMVIAESTLYLNCHVVMQHPKLRAQVGGIRYEGSLPARPTALRADSSWEQIDKMTDGGRQWANKVTVYFLCHYAPDEAAQRLEAEIRGWPFVKAVTVVDMPMYGDGIRYLSAESKAGDVRDFFTSWWDPARRGKEEIGSVVWGPVDCRPYTRAEIRAALEERRDQWAGHIRDGKVIILSDTPTSAGGIFINRRRDRGSVEWEQIVNVVRILESNLSRDLKARKIAHRIVGDASERQSGRSSRKIVEHLVAGFHADTQLSERIRALEKTVWIPLWSGEVAGK